MISWVNESVFYHIYPLGFCGAIYQGKEENISKIERWIPYFQDLGINALYLGPVFESSYHGYDTKDYYHIDKRLGSNNLFQCVVKSLHAAKIKVIVDGVFNHVGREFWAFKDIQDKGQNSKYINWFKKINFKEKSPYGDRFSYGGWEGNYDLVELNLQNQEVVEHLLGAVENWIEEFDIDGIRLDVAYSLEKDFLKKIKKISKIKKEDFWLMGEVIHGDYNTIANETMLDSATNYECYKGIYSSHNDKNYFEINYSMNRLFGEEGVYKNLCLYNFVDNHDVNRVQSQLTNKQHIYNVYTLLFTMPGVPAIYYGSEWGMEGTKEFGDDKVLRPYIEDSKMQIKNLLYSHIQRLIVLRKQLDALKYGDYETISVKNEQLVFKRQWKEKYVLVILNLSSKEQVLKVELAKEETLIDLFSNKSYISPNRCLEIKVPSCGNLLLKNN